jgi:hypothetical protein
LDGQALRGDCCSAALSLADNKPKNGTLG